MADSGSILVGSPRRLSLTNKKPTVSFLGDGKEDELGTPKREEPWKSQGTKPVEVHAFVGAISTIVAFVIYIVWAYFPDPWLHSLGITYYPDKYWAIAIPGFLIITVAFAIFVYVALNHLATPPPDSLNTLYDEFTRQPVRLPPSSSGEQPIDPMADIPITLVNQAMFE